MHSDPDRNLSPHPGPASAPAQILVSLLFFLLLAAFALLLLTVSPDPYEDHTVPSRQTTDLYGRFEALSDRKSVV